MLIENHKNYRNHTPPMWMLNFNFYVTWSYFFFGSFRKIFFPRFLVWRIIYLPYIIPNIYIYAPPSSFCTLPDHIIEWSLQFWKLDGAMPNNVCSLIYMKFSVQFFVIALWLFAMMIRLRVLWNTMISKTILF